MTLPSALPFPGEHFEFEVDATEYRIDGIGDNEWHLTVGTVTSGQMYRVGSVWHIDSGAHHRRIETDTWQEALEEFIAD